MAQQGWRGDAHGLSCAVARATTGCAGTLPHCKVSCRCFVVRAQCDRCRPSSAATRHAYAVLQARAIQSASRERGAHLVLVVLVVIVVCKQRRPISGPQGAVLCLALRYLCNRVKADWLIVLHLMPLLLFLGLRLARLVLWIACGYFHCQSA